MRRDSRSREQLIIQYAWTLARTNIREGRPSGCGSHLDEFYARTRRLHGRSLACARPNRSRTGWSRSAIFRGRGRMSILLLPCLILVLVLTPAVHPRVLVTQSQTLVSRSPILIQGNVDFTAANGVTGGNGTVANPYIISGWNISSSLSSCIEIDNTSAYFIVANVTATCSSFQVPSISGLTLTGVNNGKIVSSNFYPAVSIASSENDVFSGNVLQGAGCGAQACNQAGPVLFITQSSSITISDNHLSLGQFNSCVIEADTSSNLHVVSNTVQSDDVPCGIYYSNSNSSTISDNFVTGSTCCNPVVFANVGIIVYKSTNDQVYANNITLEQKGIRIASSTNILVFHNNMINNKIQALDDNPGKNQWDDGYPNGGNFWSDHNGTDNCSGPQQDICNGPDGIADTPYTFSSAQDRYPLIKMYVPSVDPLSANSSGTAGGGRAPLRE